MGVLDLWLFGYGSHHHWQPNEDNQPSIFRRRNTLCSYRRVSHYFFLVRFFPAMEIPGEAFILFVCFPFYFFCVVLLFCLFVYLCFNFFGFKRNHLHHLLSRVCQVSTDVLVTCYSVNLKWRTLQVGLHWIKNFKIVLNSCNVWVYGPNWHLV